MEKKIFYYSVTVQESRSFKDFYFRLSDLDKEVATFRFILDTENFDLILHRVSISYDMYKKIGLMKNFVSYILLNFFSLKEIKSISLSYNLEASLLLKDGVNVYKFLNSLGRYILSYKKSDLKIFIDYKKVSLFESDYLKYKKFEFEEKF